ncbi:hypothetical protein P3T76_009408 [Phytophthora citrophthora]|uniref:Uncharacterized protein n=1 Tax=Phytophthora citrophthora TaxID=4793 RepID=A0AAD9LIS7_9STRA|nr:hypothetical protein P3T76_009408 [Phytophthora citrophthora]
MNGKIHAVGGGDSSDKPILLVRFKDGHQTWIDLRTNKVKLRMHPLEVVAPSDMSPRVKTSNVTDASTNSELLSTECSHNTSPAAVYPTTDLTQPNPTPALFRIPSGEDLKKEAQNPPQTEEAPTMLGSPGRKPNPGKRVPALHRRASQSTDVGKHHALPDASVSLELLTVSPNNGDDIVVSALPPSKILNAAETPGIDDFVRPMSPRGTLPPVQTNSNPNSPGKTQLLVSPTQTINVGSFASDHERIAPS